MTSEKVDAIKSKLGNVLLSTHVTILLSLLFITILTNSYYVRRFCLAVFALDVVISLLTLLWYKKKNKSDNTAKVEKSTMDVTIEASNKTEKKSSKRVANGEIRNKVPLPEQKGIRKPDPVKAESAEAPIDDASIPVPDGTPSPVEPVLKKLNEMNDEDWESVFGSMDDF